MESVFYNQNQSAGTHVAVAPPPAGIDGSFAVMEVPTTLPVDASTSVNATRAPAGAAVTAVLVMVTVAVSVAESAATPSPAASSAAVKFMVERATRPSSATCSDEARTSRVWR